MVHLPLCQSTRSGNYQGDVNRIVEEKLFSRKFCHLNVPYRPSTLVARSSAPSPPTVFTTPDAGAGACIHRRGVVEKQRASIFNAALLARYTSQVPSSDVETSARLPIREVIIARVPSVLSRSKNASAKYIGLYAFEMNTCAASCAGT